MQRGLPPSSRAPLLQSGNIEGGSRVKEPFLILGRRRKGAFHEKGDSHCVTKISSSSSKKRGWKDRSEEWQEKRQINVFILINLSGVFFCFSAFTYGCLSILFCLCVYCFLCLAFPGIWHYLVYGSRIALVHFHH